MNTVIDKVDHLTEIYSHDTLSKFDHLAKKSANGDANEDSWDYFVSPLLGDNISKSIFGGSGALTEDTFIRDDLFVTADKEYTNYRDITKSIKFTKAGPRKELFCDP